MLSPATIKQLLHSFNLKPNKHLGQNFLISNTVLAKIIAAAELKPEDTVLEIGPGLGVLTLELAKHVKKVIAVEKDPKIFTILDQILKDKGINNVEVVNGDALKIQITKQGYKLIANLPYYITNPVIMKFLEAENSPELMVLMVQKEVAQRITASPPHMNKLAVFCQFLSQPKIISYVSKKCFWPSPKVDAAIIRFSRISTNFPRINTNLFAKIVNAGFSQPRKQLINNLSKGLDLTREQTAKWLIQNDIKPTQRAETLPINDWVRLTTNLT